MREEDKMVRFLFLASFRYSFVAVDISGPLIFKAQNFSESAETQMHKPMKNGTLKA